MNSSSENFIEYTELEFKYLKQFKFPIKLEHTSIRYLRLT